MMTMCYKQPSPPPMPRHLMLVPPWLKGNCHKQRDQYGPTTYLVPTSSKTLPLSHILWQTNTGVLLDKNAPQKRHFLFG